MALFKPSVYFTSCCEKLFFSDLYSVLREFVGHSTRTSIRKDFGKLKGSGEWLNRVVNCHFS